ncbi:MAG: lysophospholipid acyltransferase family protein, partial [Phycicoccus sp.]
MSPRQKAARDRAERRPYLRVAEPPPDPPLDPTVTDMSAGAGSPLPDVADLVDGVVAVLRTAAQAAGVSSEDVEHQVARVLAYARRRLDGDYDVDEFGYDAEFTETVFYPLLRPLYRHWFRVEVRGVENIPA